MYVRLKPSTAEVACCFGCGATGAFLFMAGETFGVAALLPVTGVSDDRFFT